MILPYTIYREFENNNNDNNNNDLASPLYGDLAKKEKRDIFDTSLVFIFIYRDFCWLLAVLINFNKDATATRDQQKSVPPKKPSVFYFALRTFSKNLDPERE